MYLFLNLNFNSKNTIFVFWNLISKNFIHLIYFIMKRILPFILLISFAISGFAQVRQLKPTDYASHYKLSKSNVAGEAMNFFAEANPYTANERSQDIIIGETWYDLQSNSSMMNRMYSYPDGTMAGVWTRGMTPTAYSDRGTGYNYYDGSAWGPYPTERIETTRTGWPSYAPYGANGEIVCAHTFTAAGLVLSWRENKGTGDWNYASLVGPPGHEGIAWPRMITSGENHEVIHVIANVPSTVNGGSPYEGQDGALSYSRSTDGGQTWDPDNIILEGMGADYFSTIGPDDYAWAEPHGNTIAFVYFGGITDGIVMKSMDGGDTWERITFYNSPDPFFDGNGGNLPQCGGGDGYNAIVIDDNDVVHVAFGRQIHMDDTPDDDTWSYYPYSDGLVYWNEGMAPLDTAKIGAEIIPEDWANTYLYQNGMLAAWTQDHGTDTIIGVAPYYASLVSMPQMVLHDGVLQLFYGGLAVGYDNTVYNFRHIWGRRTEMDGKWSEFTDYTGDVFHLFSECVFPSASPYATNGLYHVLYQSDSYPGTSLQPSDAPSQDPALNNMVYLPVMTAPVGVQDNIEATFEVSQNQPNPAYGMTTIVVNLKERGNIHLAISNLLGQTVYETMQESSNLGSNPIRVDVSNFDSGIYIYTVEVGNQKVSNKMLVK